MTVNANTAVLPDLLTSPIGRLYWRKWEASGQSVEGTKKSITRDWQSFIDSRSKEWSVVTTTGTLLSLTWLCLLPFSTKGGQMALLCTGPGILCALASVFTSLVYVRNRHLFECIMQDMGAPDLPFNLWTFLSLPSLYLAWSLLLLGPVLFFCLFTPAHQPFSWNVPILGIPVLLLSSALSFLVTLIPFSLVESNFRVLSQATEPTTTPYPPQSRVLKSMDESTELVTLEKALELVPTAAHGILGFSLALLAIGDFYNDPITRISLITAITAAFFAVILHLQVNLQLSAHIKQLLVLPVAFLALSAITFLFGLISHFWANKE